MTTAAAIRRKFRLAEAMPPLAGALLLLVLLGLLELAVQNRLVSPFVVPAPTRIIASIPALFVNENLLGLFFLTLSIVFTATVAALLIGLPLGYLMFRFPILGRAYEPWLGALFSAPIILLYPLFMVMLGRGSGTIIVMSFIVAVIPITLSSYSGLKSVPRVYLNVARSFNMPQQQVFFKVMVPAALPSLFTGVRLALIYAMINAVAIEFLLAMGGLGYLVGDLYDRYRIAEMYAAICFVVLASILFFMVVNRLEQWLKHH